MKRFLPGILMALVALFVFSSCGGENPLKALTGANDDREKAGEIIEYYNTSLKVLKQHSSDDLEKILKYMTPGSKRSIVSPTVLNTGLRDSSKVNNPGNYFDKEVREQLKKEYAGFLDAGNKFMENFDTFKAYLKAEDFKDDNWEKAKVLHAENEKLYEEILSHRSNIYGIITPLADQAEELLLVDNPLRDHILQGKAIFETMDNIMYEFAEDKVDVNVIDTEYTKLEEQVAKAREIKDVDGYDREMKYYTDFLDKVDTFLGTLRKARRDNKFNERNYNSLSSDYKSVVNRYNNFVD